MAFIEASASKKVCPMMTEHHLSLALQWNVTIFTSSIKKDKFGKIDS